jgi:hypothetical protein
MGQCHVCKSSDVTKRLNLGAHPVSSHFVSSAEAKENAYDVSLGVCLACGVIQLMQPLPYTALVSPFDWFSYREPEAHLDDLVREAANLFGISSASRILGVSVKDQTTIDRFAALGFSQTSILDPFHDLGVSESNAGVESVQHALTVERAQQWVSSHGARDMVVARHIVEHAEDVSGFLAAMSALLEDGGYIVLEVPDCLANLQRQDISMVWEEHTVYFTPDTLREILPDAGFEEVVFKQYPLSFEDCLVVIGRKAGVSLKHTFASGCALAADALLAAYVNGVKEWRCRYTAYLQERIERGEKIALYGAGHLSCAFVNYYGYKDLISFVVDDTPEKQGLFLPGSSLPIVPSAHLVSEDISLCLLGLALGGEDRVIANNAAFVSGGGEFMSIFAASQRSLRRLGGLL